MNSWTLYEPQYEVFYLPTLNSLFRTWFFYIKITFVNIYSFLLKSPLFVSDALIASTPFYNQIVGLTWSLYICYSLPYSKFRGLNHVTLSVLTFCKQQFKTNSLNENIKFDVLVDLIVFMTIQE